LAMEEKRLAEIQRKQKEKEFFMCWEEGREENRCEENVVKNG
jgi:hypothetical protein